MEPDFLVLYVDYDRSAPVSSLSLPGFRWFWMWSNTVFRVATVDNWCMTSCHGDILDDTWPPFLVYRINWVSRINQELRTTPFWYTHGAWVLTLPSSLILESLWAQAPGTDSFFLCHLAGSRMEAELKGRRGKSITCILILIWCLFGGSAS